MDKKAEDLARFFENFLKGQAGSQTQTGPPSLEHTQGLLQEAGLHDAAPEHIRDAVQATTQKFPALAEHLSAFTGDNPDLGQLVHHLGGIPSVDLPKLDLGPGSPIHVADPLLSGGDPLSEAENQGRVLLEGGEEQGLDIVKQFAQEHGVDLASMEGNAAAESKASGMAQEGLAAGMQAADGNVDPLLHKAEEWAGQYGERPVSDLLHAGEELAHGDVTGAATTVVEGEVQGGLEAAGVDPTVVGLGRAAIDGDLDSLPDAAKQEAMEAAQAAGIQLTPETMAQIEAGDYGDAAHSAAVEGIKEGMASAGIPGGDMVNTLDGALSDGYSTQVGEAAAEEAIAGGLAAGGGAVLGPVGSIGGQMIGEAIAPTVVEGAEELADGAGELASDAADAASDAADSVGELASDAGDMASDAGDALSDAGDAVAGALDDINPFG